MVTRGSYYCYLYCSCSTLPVCHQEGGELRPVPVFGLQDSQGQAGTSVHRLWPSKICRSTLAKPARQTCWSSPESRRKLGKSLQCLGAPPTPLSSPQAGPDCLAREESTPKCCRHLCSPSPLLTDGSVALALPQQQVAFAAWHLFLEGGCQKGENPGIACLVCPPSESLHERGLCAAWRGWSGPALVDGVRGGACSVIPEPPAHPPGESQESQVLYPEVCVLGTCYGRRGAGLEDREEVERGTGEGSCFHLSGQPAS
jgi:hypothetical protein